MLLEISVRILNADGAAFPEAQDGLAEVVVHSDQADNFIGYPCLGAIDDGLDNKPAPGFVGRNGRYIQFVHEHCMIANVSGQGNLLADNGHVRFLLVTPDGRTLRPHIEGSAHISLRGRCEGDDGFLVGQGRLVVDVGHYPLSDDLFGKPGIHVPIIVTANQENGHQGHGEGEHRFFHISRYLFLRRKYTIIRKQLKDYRRLLRASRLCGKARPGDLRSYKGCRPG